MHRWIATTIFPRADPRPINNTELQLMYAMVKKIRVSPIRSMVDHWKSLPNRVGSIAMTSLVTRLATRLGYIDNAVLDYIPGDHP